MPEATSRSRTNAVDPNRALTGAHQTQRVITWIRLSGAGFMADLEINLLTEDPAAPFTYPMGNCNPTRAQASAIAKALGEWSATVQERQRAKQQRRLEDRS